MQDTEIGDPRLQALFGASEPRDAGVQPIVELPRKGLSAVAVVIGAVLLGLLLFAILNGQRRSQAEPSENALRAGVSSIIFEPPPPLYIPSAPPPTMLSAPTMSRPAQVPVAAPNASQRTLPPQVVYAPQPIPMPQIAPPQAPAPSARTSAGSALVMDSSASMDAPGTPPTGASSPLGPSGQTVSRMRASAFANRSMTVPQGFLILAVLETGFDSTKPGFARAVVSRDVRGFDGSTVLIPRGSRLIGEYGSEVAEGQKRAAIIWTRLIRPDGMTVALDSPAVDTVGRGGIAASVNTHFFERLGNALLQSSFEVGRVFAKRAIDDPVIVVSGNATTAAAQSMPATNYSPTLKVPAGRSISVFVAHDLDFSAADVSR